MALPVVRHRFTVADYERMGATGVLGEDDRVELIAGEIVDMSPIGFRHVACLNELTYWVSKQVGADVRLSVQNPLRLSDGDEPQPDLVVVRRHAGYARALPTAADALLVVEVADTSLAYDRDVKVPLYAKAGIPEVWLLDVAGQVLFRYAEPREGVYRRTDRFGRGERLNALALPDLTIAVDDLFA